MQEDWKEIDEKLKKPFPEEDIEWRVLRTFKWGNKQKAVVVPYLENRAIQNRLDELFGPFGWENEFKEIHQGVLCGIRIWFGDRAITKWDGADLTNFEKTKGGISNSMKRAAVEWGIGRYLYQIEEQTVDVYPEKTKKNNFNYVDDKKTKVKGYWISPVLSTGNASGFHKNQLKSTNITSSKERQALINCIKDYLMIIDLIDEEDRVIRLFSKATNNNQIKSYKELLETATDEELKEFAYVLKPVNDVVVITKHYDLDINRTLEFLQIIKPQINVKSLLHLFFVLDKNDLTQLSDWAKSEGAVNRRTA
ncbi:Rad52/Rad22 family DNA repair protein [Bacillus swezeyi]|uniref:Recombinase n=1 Tax=Bacillus swezeyi TaxID=1925020 RepID=A0A5M8REG4_9BACI|nr:Rad52/Rad22 family DNA repair protein [Bacillus swezeyi]KAA6446997.1 hypothetical protein DX927_23430 [Bacillus swezeyi]KAA6471565.1 hypothetical protein DX928_23670 [Bacillus swezeyi]